MSEAGTFSVTPAEVAAAAAKLKAGESSLIDLLSQLKAVVDQTATSWTGASQTRFAELNARWQHACEQCHEALADIANQTSTAAKAYSDTESSNQSLFTA